jgi:hypothetical protein
MSNMAIHEIFLAFKTASTSAKGGGQDTLYAALAWSAGHLALIKDGLSIILTCFLILSAILKFAKAGVDFYYTIKNKGVDGE